MTEIIVRSIRIVSKKNNPQLIRRGRVTFRLPSKSFEKIKSLMWEHFYPFKGDITRPFKMSLWYSIKGKYPIDIDNSTTSVLDVLQDYGVIENDNLCQEMHAYKTNGNKDWMFVIRLEEL